MRTSRLIAVVLAIAILVAWGCTRKVTEVTETKVVSPSTAAYIGSEECGTCHDAIYTSFRNSGHPYKINEAEDAQVAGYYPYTTIPSPPSGVSWDDVDKVIGGFRWKARFIDNDGFIITGSDVQYNFVDSSWTAYHDGEIKPYDCGPCHMTNYKSTGNQEGKAGLVGTWEFNGIQCEECHGPGELHAADPYEIAMVVDYTSESCGKCHHRGPETAIPASGGFIKHHEQWNEIFTTKHNALKCVDCHDPHMGLHPLNPERGAAIKVNCEGCHFEEAASFEASSINHAGSAAGPSCIDCHMARAAKSAVAAGPYEGDIRSHLFRINTDADAEMFTPDGSFANGYLTLEYTCLTCHSDDDKAWAATWAGAVHADNNSSSCFSCHSDSDVALSTARQQFDNSLHGSGNNTDRNRLYRSYYASCEKCHTNEGFVAEQTGIPADGLNFTAISCFTCHAPHTDGNLGVRGTAAVTLANAVTYDRGVSNLCANCHQSRRDVTVTVVDDVELSSHWGPHHSNQGDMLIGTNAYEYAGYNYDVSWHATGVTEGCVACHMSASRHETIAGHSWNMRNEDRGFENITGCNVDGCHSAEPIDDLDRPAADFDGDGDADEGIQTEIDGLLHHLDSLLFDAGLVNVEGHPVSGVVVSTADSAGALYNFLFVEEDRSRGVHNTDYTVGLLQSSINFLETGSPNGVSGGK